jgi:hypothetical protein
LQASQNLAGITVRDHGFQSIPNLHPRTSLLDRNQDQETIGLILLADAPLLKELYRVVFDGLSMQRVYGDDGELHASFGFQLLAELFNALAGWLIQDVSEIINVS